jgi:hypothetical protein
VVTTGTSLWYTKARATTGSVAGTAGQLGGNRSAVGWIPAAAAVARSGVAGGSHACC